MHCTLVRNWLTIKSHLKTSVKISLILFKIQKRIVNKTGNLDQCALYSYSFQINAFCLLHSGPLLIIVKIVLKFEIKLKWTKQNATH